MNGINPCSELKINIGCNESVFLKTELEYMNI